MMALFFNPEPGQPAATPSDREVHRHNIVLRQETVEKQQRSKLLEMANAEESFAKKNLNAAMSNNLSDVVGRLLRSTNLHKISDDEIQAENRHLTAIADREVKRATSLEHLLSDAALPEYGPDIEQRVNDSLRTIIKNEILPRLVAHNQLHEEALSRGRAAINALKQDFLSNKDGDGVRLSDIALGIVNISTGAQNERQAWTKQLQAKCAATANNFRSFIQRLRFDSAAVPDWTKL